MDGRGEEEGGSALLVTRRPIPGLHLSCKEFRRCLSCKEEAPPITGTANVGNPNVLNEKDERKWNRAGEERLQITSAR